MKPWLVEQWCLAPTADPEFVWRMEDVLETYKLPYDPRFPQVVTGAQRGPTPRAGIGE